MPKMKTHKGAAKRFKRTAKGKFKRRQATHGHYRTVKSGSKKRKLRQAKMASKPDEKRLRRMLGG